MVDLHEMAQAAESKGRETSALIDAQAVERAASHETLMDAFDKLDAAFANVFAQIPKPINPRGE